ncbi:MAG: hypothetical protein ABJN40_16965 [Sneathiella sp.]
MQQIEQQEFTNRPGFAKRAAIPTPIKKPLSIKDPKDLSGYEIQKAIALGLPDLTAQERDLLQFYAAFLNIIAVKEGKASVWPSNRVTCQLLGISEASLRRYKAALEYKGYIFRRYDQRNRPLERGAIDLVPFLCQVEGLRRSTPVLRRSASGYRRKREYMFECPPAHR